MVTANYRSPPTVRTRVNRIHSLALQLLSLIELAVCVAEALKHFSSFLTEYEKKEITSYPEIWCLGLYACKVRPSDDPGTNFGYDNSNGNYIKVSCALSAFP